MSNELKVETVKKGDVLFYLESKLSLFEKLLSFDEQSQVEFIDNNNLKEWYDGRISARTSSIESIKELRTLISNL
jgi:hypothetical protein